MWGFLVALISGALMSIQGVFNTEMTKQTSLWVSTGWVQFSAFLVCVLAWIFTGRDSVGALWQVENKYTLLGGIIGAFITITVIQSMGSLGPAKAAMLIVISQLAVAYIIELFGLFGADLMGKFWIGEIIGMIGNDHVPGEVISLFHDIIFSHFCCHGKFQIRSFRRTAKRRDEFLFIRLIWIRDIGHSLFHCRFDWKDLNVSHIFFTISFSSSISCGVAVPTVFATLASWLMFTPILCIS